MISEEKFYEIVMINFKEIQDKIDLVKSSVNDLCTRTSINEKEIDDIVKEGVKNSERKHWIITSVFGSIAAIATIINVWAQIFS